MLNKIRSSVVHSLCTACAFLWQCGAHVVPCSLITILLHFLPPGSAGPLYLTHAVSLYRTILMTAYSTVWTCELRVGSMLLCWLELLSIFVLSCFFFFLSIGSLCGVGEFGPIGCIHSIPTLKCTTIIINNNNNESNDYLYYQKNRVFCPSVRRPVIR